MLRVRRLRLVRHRSSSVSGAHARRHMCAPRQRIVSHAAGAERDPARVRAEALAVSRRELVESRDARRRRRARARSAAARRETARSPCRRSRRRRSDRRRRRPLAQHGDRFVEQRQHQPVGEIVRIGAAPRRAASRPCRPATRRSPAPLLRPSLPASTSGATDSGAGSRRTPAARMRPDVQADIEADGVGELDRAHRHAELHGGAIDHGERHAFAARRASLRSGTASARD